MAGSCHVTDNVEGTTHNEMRSLHPPPGMETTERMNCSGQDCRDKTFRDTPTWPSQDSTSVLSAAEMEKKIGEEKKKQKQKQKSLPSPLPACSKEGFQERSLVDSRERGGREQGGASGWDCGCLLSTDWGSLGRQKPCSDVGFAYSNVYPASRKPRVWD